MPKPKTAKAPAAESLLVELVTEELPPKSLKRLSLAFADALSDYLRDGEFIGAKDAAEEFATPRRLAALVPNVRKRQPDSVVERKGPSVPAGLDAAGKPTAALTGFARSCGVDPAKLDRRRDAKGEYFLYRIRKTGEPLSAHLAGYVEQAVKRLPVAKLMCWNSHDVQFVRPVHGVVMLHGSKVVPGEVLGLKSSNKTRGHRFMSKGPIVIKHARDYEKALRTQGKVIASFETRREEIVSQLDRAANRLKSKWQPGRGLVIQGPPDAVNPASHSNTVAAALWILQGNAAMLDEVAAIVEWPVVYQGEFDPRFLELPTPCIGLTMQKNQKYFPLVEGGTAKLLPKYLIVGNIEVRRARRIIDGNARVLRARLSDARFFYDQDRKQKLEYRVPRLNGVVYHSKLGSQFKRVERLMKLAVAIAKLLRVDAALAERAAFLCKADLLTDMVGEFPELQGLMGYYYARHDGESDPVAGAIREQYLPRFAGDVLPRTPVGICLALADKLDTLVGIFGIGLAPTGEKDPFGLRRAALGVLRILLERSSVEGSSLALDISELLECARSQFENVSLASNVTRELQGFLYDRLRPYLRERKYAADEIEAVLALQPTRLDHVIPRLEAIRTFRAAPEGRALAAANKRIQNILRQASGGDPDKITPAIDSALFREGAEQELAVQLADAAKRIRPLTAAGKFGPALQELSHLRQAVDTFFDKVMVMVEDENVRTARLQLLAQIRKEFREIADISMLQG